MHSIELARFARSDWMMRIAIVFTGRQLAALYGFKLI